MEKVSVSTVQKNNAKITVIRTLKPQSTAKQSVPATPKNIPVLKSNEVKVQTPRKTITLPSSLIITPLNSHASPILAKPKTSTINMVSKTVPVNHGAMKNSVVNTLPVPSSPAMKTLTYKATTVKQIIANQKSLNPTTVNAIKPTTTVSSISTPSILNRTAGLSRTETNSTVQKPLVVTPVPNVIDHDPLAISPTANSPTVSLSAKSPPTNSRPAKRIAPTKISDTVTLRACSIEKSSDSDMLSRDSSTAAHEENATNNVCNGEALLQPSAKRPRLDSKPQRTIPNEYLKLIEVCKKADPSEDMKKILAKLEKNYRRAHSDFVSSRSFFKLLAKVTNDIEARPLSVYAELGTLLDELKMRRTVENTSAPEQAAEVSSTDEKNKKQIELLSKALRTLQKKIRRSEMDEVDLDDELNSKYLLTERYKERAYKIYEKLCDLTGESRTAERMVKKPIKYKGNSHYPEFNKKLEKFINQTKSFPDLFDVIKIMDHCNKQYGYRLDQKDRVDEGKSLFLSFYNFCYFKYETYVCLAARLAFQDVGKMLQKRRKADLYEMVQYFTANQSDPAVEDPLLKSKLEENQKNHNRRINEVIEK